MKKEDSARHETIAKQFENEPSREELVQSGELSGHPIPMWAYLELTNLMYALKKERKRAGMSLAELAEKSGLAKAALSRLENGRQHNPTLETLARYATALGKQIGLYLKEKETAPPKQQEKGEGPAAVKDPEN